MVIRDQRGLVQPLMIPMIIVVFLLVIMTGVSIWSYTQFTDQRDKVNARVEEAIGEANDRLEADLQAEFAEREKSPLATFSGSAALGSIVVKYPKTWSAYVKQRESGSGVGIDAYFHPIYVPDVQSKTAYALRVVLEDSAFSEELKGFQRRIENKSAKSSPISISNVQGVRLDGEFNANTDGAMVLLPLRDKTLKIYTESKDFVQDFNDIVLKNLSFIP